MRKQLLQEKAAKKPVKAAAIASKPGKRKGPLPLWLAELLVIFGIVGILYAVARWCALPIMNQRGTA